VPVLGDLDDAGLLASASADVDLVVDTATADHAESTTAFLEALAGTGKTYIRTSGTGVYTDLASGEASDAIYTEATEFTPAPVVATRVASDRAVLEAGGSGLRTIVIRPSMIYGDGASEQLPLLIRNAIITRRSIYAGAGENRWSHVYLPDLAELYLLAIREAPSASVYNVGAGEAAMRDIAGAVARLVGLEGAQSVPAEEAWAAFGERWVQVALSSNSRVDSTLAREQLGWDPKGPALLDDVATGSYRRVWAYKGDPHDHVTRH
jgi:nucleoside-diphosphate-sugar epimerase